MVRFFRSVFLSSMIVLFFASVTFAALEWSIETAIPLNEVALASAQSPDGSRLFVLTGSGKILILNQAGKLVTTIDGSFKAESLSVSNDGKKLFLAGKGQKNIQVVSLLDRFDIPVGKSPFKGDIAAAVTVATFSDFQ